jgi:hypothetical protein
MPPLVIFLVVRSFGTRAAGGLISNDIAEGNYWFLRTITPFLGVQTISHMDRARRYSEREDITLNPMTVSHQVSGIAFMKRTVKGY